MDTQKTVGVALVALVVGLAAGHYGQSLFQRQVHTTYVYNAPDEVSSSSAPHALAIGGSPRKGPVDAAVTIVESSDFQ